MSPPRKKDPFADLPPNLGPCAGLRLIGRGAMGAVFRGHHTGLGIDVAVKVVNPQLGQREPVMLQRFVREVRLLAAIRDPNVVRVMDAGQEGKFTYAIMELIEGESLGAIKARQPQQRLRPGDAAYYLARVAQGLDAVHRCGVVHRDIKPDNVMVDAHGQCKIADFGLARGQDSQQLTMAGELVGTPEYMAPEVIQSAEIDGRADLYSLGITAYELLSGHTPFNQGGLIKVVQDQLHKVPKPVQLENPDVPDGLAAVVHKLLEKEAGRRYASAVEASRAFEAFAVKSPPHRAQLPEPAPAPAPAHAPAHAPPQGGGRGGPAPATGRFPAGQPAPGPAAPASPAAPGAASGPLPPWEALFLVRLLAQHRVYPLDTLLDGLTAWQRGGNGQPFAVFLTQRAGLPVDTARKASAAAQKAATGFRDRIALQAVQRSCPQLPQGSLQAIAQAPRPEGVSLVSTLVRNGLIERGQGEAIERTIEQSLQTGATRAVQATCARVGLPAQPLDQLRAKLPPERFQQVVREVVKTLLQQL